MLPFGTHSPRSVSYFISCHFEAETDSSLAAIAIFLLLVTIAFSIIVMRNFGRGLKNSSKYSGTKLAYLLNPLISRKPCTRRFSAFPPRTPEHEPQPHEHRLKMCVTWIQWTLYFSRRFRHVVDSVLRSLSFHPLLRRSYYTSLVHNYTTPRFLFLTYLH